MTAANAAAGGAAAAQAAARSVAARVHIGREGIVTVMTGKVEGDGARAELTQAAAEELRLPVEQVRLLMADAAVPGDGITAGSRSTPSTVPSIRQGARETLVRVAAKTWSVATESLDVRDGKVVAREGGRSFPTPTSRRRKTRRSSSRRPCRRT